MLNQNRLVAKGEHRGTLLPGSLNTGNSLDPQPTWPNRSWSTEACDCLFPGGTRAGLRRFSSRGGNGNCQVCLGRNPWPTHLPILLTKRLLEQQLGRMLAYGVDTLAFSKKRLFFSHNKQSRGNYGVGIQVRTWWVPLGRCKLAQKDGMGLHLKQRGTKLLTRKPKNAWMNMKPDTGEGW